MKEQVAACLYWVKFQVLMNVVSEVQRSNVSLPVFCLSTAAAAAFFINSERTIMDGKRKNIGY
jgi:hypothetical protein